MKRVLKIFNNNRKKLLMILLIMVYGLFVYKNLDISALPLVSDVIIVLEGDNAERAYKGVELLLAGYSRSDKIIVSPYYELENFKVSQWYLDAGALQDQLVYDYESTSTYSNAINSIQIMEDNNWESAIVVTNDYHLRRAKLSFERASAGKDLDFSYVAAYPTVNGEQLTYREYSPNRIKGIQEVLKYFGYLFYLYHIVDL